MKDVKGWTVTHTGDILQVTVRDVEEDNIYPRYWFLDYTDYTSGYNGMAVWGMNVFHSKLEAYRAYVVPMREQARKLQEKITKLDSQMGKGYRAWVLLNLEPVEIMAYDINEGHYLYEKDDKVVFVSKKDVFFSYEEAKAEARRQIKDKINRLEEALGDG